MKLHAYYEIEITDPEQGVCDHEVDMVVWGRRSRLSGSAESRYRQERTSLGFKKLDFFVNKRKSTILVFKIAARGWTFNTDNPIEFPAGKNGGNPVFAPRPTHRVWLRSETELRVRIFGRKEVDRKEPEQFEYCLNYKRPNGKDYQHDPIIRNSSEHPDNFSSLFLSIFPPTVIPFLVGAVSVGLGFVSLKALGLF